MKAGHDAIVVAYLTELRERLRYTDTESAEAVIGEPIRDLVRELAAAAGRPEVDLRGQAREPGIGRPDFSVKDGPALIGHVEIKTPGAGADPAAFKTKHDKDQWQRFKKLPNLLYSDGLSFALFRSGKRLRLDDGPARITFDIDLGSHTVIGPEVYDFKRLVQMIDAFLGWQPIQPTTLEELADRLAPLCATLRDAVLTGLRIDGSSVALVSRDVRDALFPYGDDQLLADAYAQTCAYSMLLARSERAPSLSPADVENTLHSAHPVIARVVRVLLDPYVEDEIAWAVDLVRRQLEAVDFGAFKQQGPETWLYFYETFLAAYDPQLRESRGVYYTPKEIITAQVALAEDILMNRLGKPQGFASPGVTVLDPAAGTGSYPLAVIAAAERRAASLGAGAVPAAVTDLAARLHAFELLVGPYSVAHLRITQAIKKLGGSLPKDGVNVYLTDTLASPDLDPPSLTAALEPLVAEQRRARRFKSETHVVVCIGNPPYDREQRGDGESQHERKGGWVRKAEQGPSLMDDFTEPLSAAGLGGHAKNLFNDYVYFWRWAMWKVFERDQARLELTGGIVSYISASSFIHGPGFAYFRKRLRDFCDDIYVIDLGGQRRGSRRTANVFQQIKTPVAITVAVRDPGTEQPRAGRVHYVDWSDGARGEKLARLAGVKTVGGIPFERGPTGATEPFHPEIEGAYAHWPLLTDLLPWQHSGIQVKRNWPVSPTKEPLRARWKALVTAPPENRAELFVATRDRGLDSEPGPILPDAAPRHRLSAIESSDPNVAKQAAALDEKELVAYEYRSFDRHFLIRDERVGDYLRPVLWRTHSDKQIYLTTLLTEPLGEGPAITAAAVSPPDLHYFCGRGGKDILPLYRDEAATKPNVTHGVLELLSLELGKDVDAQTLCAYILGVLGTSAFTDTFTAELSVAGPRVPLTTDRDRFENASEIGRRVGFLQSRGARFMRDDWALPAGTARIETAIPTTVAECPREIFYDPDAETLRIGTGEIRPVLREVWDFRVSGFDPVKAWVLRRLAQPYIEGSSALDEIRPIAWDFTMQTELMETLAIVEEIVTEITPRARAVLAEIIAGPTIVHGDLPGPTLEERRAPATKIQHQQGLL